MSFRSASASHLPEAFTQSLEPILMDVLPVAACTSRGLRPRFAESRLRAESSGGCDNSFLPGLTRPIELFEDMERAFAVTFSRDRIQLHSNARSAVCFVQELPESAKAWPEIGGGKVSQASVPRNVLDSVVRCRLQFRYRHTSAGTVWIRTRTPGVPGWMTHSEIVSRSKRCCKRCPRHAGCARGSRRRS